MQATVTPEQRQAAKREIVRQIEQGASAQEARVRSRVPMHRATVYRLLKRVQSEGERAFVDGRHGHPVKLRGEVLAFLIEHCQADPCVSSPAVQRAIGERFGFAPSVSQLNRVRAHLGQSRRKVAREKKPKASLSIEPGYHEHAGGLLLLAAAHETALLAHLCEALPTEVAPACPPLAGSSAAVRQRLLLTLLFLGAVGPRVAQREKRK
jgi:transposase